MSHIEQPPHHEHSEGMPDIPPEVIEAFKNIPPNPDATYRDAKQNRATIIAWLQTEAERQRLSAEQKRGFLLGALALMGLYDFDKRYSEEIVTLEQLFIQDTYTDEHHTKPPT